MTAKTVLLSALVWAPFVALVVAAMVSDALRYRIANAISIALVALFAVVASKIVALPLTSHVVTALAVFAVTAAAFYAGVFGGGDVKLLSALALWAGPAKIMPLLLIMSIIGALLGLATWIERRRSAARHSSSWPLSIVAKWAADGHVPYALAIGPAALVTIPEWLVH
jgi:prepilin peptidase CpaA